MTLKGNTMKLKNKISDITRQNIADEMTMVEIWYHGNQTEPDFLAQLFNLNSLHFFPCLILLM